MRDMEWKMINLEMEDFKYRLSKLVNPYVKEEAKATMLDPVKDKLIKRGKRIKVKD